MTKDEKQTFCAKIDYEGGLEYIVNGSNFPEIKDPVFHSLRTAFVKAHTELAEYTGLDDWQGVEE